MKKWKEILFIIIPVFVGVCLSLLGHSCANSSTAPTGGPKDTIPPILLRMQPVIRTTNFSSKELTFSFDEYVKLKDQQKEFTISPAPEKKPELKLRGKSVVVRFLDDLLPNTTYYVDFGASIVDLNEDNPAEQINYVFSTGPVLDSLVYAGHTVDAFTLEPIPGAFLFLYEENTDSIPFKKQPSALARADKGGVFLAKGLKDTPYKAVVVLDANSNLRYDRVTEKIAFADSLIRPLRLGEHDSIAFNDLPIYNLFTEIATRQSMIDYKRMEERMIQLIFSAPHPTIDVFDLKGLDENKILQENNATGDTIKYWLTQKDLPDTIHATLAYLKTDTLNALSPDTIQLKFVVEKKAASKNSRRQKDEDEEEDEPVLEPSITLASTRILEYNIPVSFKTPLANGIASKIQLMKYDDEGKEKAPVPIQLVKDSVGGLRTYYLKAAWEKASKYELTLLPGAFIDIYRATNDTIVKPFETANPDKYGSLEVELKNAQKQYIVQLMREKNVAMQKVVRGGAPVIFSYIEAGKYRIKIIEDDNANGIWDTGDYLAKRHAERVLFLVFSNGDDTINVRPNWELIETIDIQELFSKP